MKIPPALVVNAPGRPDAPHRSRADEQLRGTAATRSTSRYVEQVTTTSGMSMSVGVT